MVGKKTVQDIVVDRLIERIQADNRLPWQKPFQSASMNWYSNREYRGINIFLLDGGEYITPNQLKQYNERKKTNFWFDGGTPYEIVVFYSKYEKKISDKEAQDILKKPNGHLLVKPTQNGRVRISWTLRYYRVYNIKFIRDIVNPAIKENPNFKDGVYEKREVKTSKGTHQVLALDKHGDPVLKDGITKEDLAFLEPKLGNTVIEEHTPADKIVETYTSATGVGIKRSSNGAYYTEMTDSVYLPPKNYFASTEAYYRVMFHELIHSTGIAKRLNRQCFHEYHQGSKERSREELIAEVGSLLLASEAGFRDDTEWVDNSIEYVAGWCSWMKDNKAQVLNGMLAAEKAKNFILSGGVDAGAGSDKSIDNPNEKSEDADVSTDEDVITEPTGSNTDKESTGESKSSKTKFILTSLKTKKDVKEFYDRHLANVFDLDKEEQKEILAKVTSKDLKHLYKVLTGEEIPTVRRKIDALKLIRQEVDALARIR